MAKISIDITVSDLVYAALEALVVDRAKQPDVEPWMLPDSIWRLQAYADNDQEIRWVRADRNPVNQGWRKLFVEVIK